RSSVEIHGIPLHIVDTAGLRETSDPVEQIGIERAWSAIAQADLALIVVDAREAPSATDARIVARLPAALPRIILHNKIDLAGTAARRADAGGAPDVRLAAKTGAGAARVCDP